MARLEATEERNSWPAYTPDNSFRHIRCELCYTCVLLNILLRVCSFWWRQRRLKPFWLLNTWLSLKSVSILIALTFLPPTIFLHWQLLYLGFVWCGSLRHICLSIWQIMAIDCGCNLASIVCPRNNLLLQRSRSAHDCDDMLKIRLCCLLFWGLLFNWKADNWTPQSMLEQLLLIILFCNLKHDYVKLEDASVSLY